MMWPIRRVLPCLIPVLLACAGHAGPDPVAPAPCAVGDSSLIHEVLYLGRRRPDGRIVSEAEWRRFLDDVFTPRFPSLTVVEATGRWRGANGDVEEEPTEVVTLLHAGDSASAAAVTQVALAYKQRFGQEAVLRERLPTCTRLE